MCAMWIETSWTVLDSERHIIPQRLTERSMERKEPIEEESLKEEKAETTGNEKIKERKRNVSTKSQNFQRSSGQVNLGNNCLINLGMLKPILRVGVTITGKLQIRILRLQQQPKKFSVRLSAICDSNLGYFKHIESFQHDR